MPDVVFAFSFVTWDGACQRGMGFPEDRLLARLLTDDRVGRLVVANPYRSAMRRIARRALGRDRPFPVDRRLSLFSPLRLRRDDPASVAEVERSYRTYDRALERHAVGAGLTQPLVISAHPLIAAYAPLDWAGPVTFYATDDWSAHSEYRELGPALHEGYRRLRTNGRKLCAVSQELVDHVKPRGPAVVVPNGIDPEEWLTIGEPPAWLERLPRPRLLYLGTLDSRIDVDGVRSVAEQFRQASVIMVGPTTDAAHLAPLLRIENVHLHPEVARAEVPGLVAAADACLVPHRRTPLTHAMSPLKLYEYLAAGRPVAAVDLPPIRAVGSPRVVLVERSHRFADAVEEALELGPAPEEERLAFVSENSWQRRHDELLSFAFRRDVGR